ncbi:MAG TPA: protease inhibitor I42 family protein [Gammaproteobacteria bacterium]|nr:protease inhibitor I42 family protein [Gammaproteobacteria bacterium]
MLKKLLVFIVVLILPALTFAEASTIHVTKQSPEFRITEPSNGSTGYQWTVNYDHALLDLKSEKNIPAKSKLIGAGGETVWVFTAKPEAFQNSTKQTMVKLIYARPWDTKDDPKEMFFVVEFNS